MDEVFSWIVRNLLTAIVIAVATPFAIRISRTFISRGIRRAIRPSDHTSKHAEKQREDTLISITTAVVRVTIWGVSGMLILSSLGVNIGPLLAASSVIGVGIGFGAQDAIKDLIAGVFIILENQYRVGDVVEIAGVTGTVQAITIRETVLRNLDGDELHVPNGVVQVSKNMTMDFSKVVMDIGIGYDSDIEKVEKVVNKVGEEMAKDEEWSELILEQPTFQRVENFGANEVEIRIVSKVEAGKQWGVAGELRKRIKVAFDKNNIEIPFPQRVIHTAKK